MVNASSLEEYLAGFPDDIAERLRQVRAVVVDAVTQALGDPPEERVRYGMPAVMLDERAAVYYAGWKKHIALYPVARLSDELEAEIAGLRAAKDTVQLKHAQELPLDLVRRITTEVVARYRS